MKVQNYGPLIGMEHVGFVKKTMLQVTAPRSNVAHVVMEIIVIATDDLQRTFVSISGWQWVPTAHPSD